MNLMLICATLLVLSGCALAFLRSRESDGAGTGQLDLAPEDVARMPDRVGLVRVDSTSTPLPMAILSISGELESQGFEDGGTFAFEGLPGVRMRLLANPSQSMYAAVWEHPAAGPWVECWTQYPGGRKCTFTTLTGAGLDGRPGHTVVRMPGARPLELYLKACTERPMGVFMPATAQQAQTEFENGYMMWRAWRRAQDRTRRIEAA